MRVLHRKCLLQISRNDYLFRLAEVETCSQNLNENRHCWVRTYPSVNLALCVPKKSSLSKRDLGTARSLARVLPDIGANTILYSLLCIFYRLTPSPEWPMLKSSCTLLPKVFSDFTLPHRHTHTLSPSKTGQHARPWLGQGREKKGREEEDREGGISCSMLVLVLVPLRVGSFRNETQRTGTLLSKDTVVLLRITITHTYEK